MPYGIDAPEPRPTSQAPWSRDAGPEQSYCRRCLGDVPEDAERCPHCARCFTGAGRYDRLLGPAPQGTPSDAGSSAT